MLASSSPYRAQQLASLGIAFDCEAADIDESPLIAEPPARTARRLARLKAETVAERVAARAAERGAARVAERAPDAIIIGADQVAELDGVAIGKPGSHAAASQQLRAMSNRELVFHSALCVRRRSPEFLFEATVPTRVAVRELSDAAIDAYLRYDKPYDCAGSFRIESRGIALMRAVTSDDPSALIGLPLIATAAALRDAGVTV
ncbi:MAG: septum formation protein Maf [Gammaproteobacteria bacterium]|nr:MAG: septum formation protein Maf [Gammaproteobacteria bacterium]PIE36616.1 MAG: septum formation protein Maf [Gammaproteobacteria bacterium]